jgi:hypothetical protein
MAVAIGESVLEKFHKKYIAGTQPGDMVPEVRVLVVKIDKAIAQACNLPSRKVYITTRALKHLHERRSSADYDFIANNIWAALKYPSAIYKNIDGKRGEFLFAKVMKNNCHYGCAVCVDIIDGCNVLCIATAFKNTRGNYFKKCEVLWALTQNE